MPAPIFKLPFRFLRVAGPHRVLWLGGPLLRYSWTFAMRDFTAVVSEVSPAGDVLSLDLSFNEPLNSSRLHFHPPLPSSAAPVESPTPYQGDLK